MKSLATVVVVLSALALLMVTSTAALASDSTVTSDRARATRPSNGSLDWLHALQVVSNLRARPPKAPLVLILGNSMAREATISDGTLAAAIERRCHRRVVARNVASSNQAFGRDAALVPYVPTRRTIILIGVDLVRFSQAPVRVKVVLPAPAPLPAYQQHLYSSSNIVSLSEKQELVTQWTTEVYPDFQRNHDDDLAALEQIIVACEKRGLRPVLLSTPWNTAVVGRSWNAPMTAIRDGCVSLASKYDIPFVNLVGQANFVSEDFFDLLHAVEPGRAKFQRLLAAKTARLITRYFPKD